MDDLISRQAAIDTLADMHCKSDEDGYVWIIRSDAWARIDVLPPAQPEQRWIPCSERLPMTKDDYIITVKDKSLTWTDYVEWSADYHWWGYDDDMVIAWMPLPEPYKGE